MKLIVHTFFINQFFWDRDFGNWHGTTEASDLGFRCGQVPYVQIYDDACDVGFEVLNPTTKVSKLFTLFRENTSDGDLQSWDFISQDNTVTIRIYND